MAPEITKAEREELLAAHARTTRPTRDHLPTDAGDKKLLRDSTLLPRLLRALDAAEAENAALKTKLAEAKAERLNYRAECLELLRRIREGQLVTATEASMRYESIIAAAKEPQP